MTDKSNDEEKLETAHSGFLKRLERADKRRTGMRLTQLDVFMLSGFFSTAIAEQDKQNDR